MSSRNKIHVHISDQYLSLQTVPREVLECEIALISHKWFAYRFMSPRCATAKFISDYEEAYKCNVDIDRAASMKLNHKLITTKNNARYTQFWKARQRADALGMPYDQYLEFTFDFALARKRTHLPQPNQLAPTRKQEAAWHAKLKVFWTDDRQTNEFHRMKPIPQYSVEGFRGFPMQKDFKDELFRLARSSAYPMTFLGARIHRFGQLSVDECKKIFGEGNVERGLAEAKDQVARGAGEVVIYPKISTVDLLPGCFGLLGPSNEADADCQRCPTQNACGTAFKTLSGKLKSATGFDDPLEEKRKRKQRERTSRCRARKKATAFP